MGALGVEAPDGRTLSGDDLQFLAEGWVGADAIILIAGDGLNRVEIACLVLAQRNAVIKEANDKFIELGLCQFPGDPGQKGFLT